MSNDGGGDVDDESGTEAESLEDRIVRVVKAHREIVEEAVVRQIDEPVDVVYESIDKAVSEGRIQQTVSEVYGRKRRHLVA